VDEQDAELGGSGSGIARASGSAREREERIKRRERDSNPRNGYPFTRFPVAFLRPLGHLSGEGGTLAHIRAVFAWGCRPKTVVVWHGRCSLDVERGDCRLCVNSAQSGVGEGLGELSGGRMHYTDVR
jgi:hypothetical protein